MNVVMKNALIEMNENDHQNKEQNFNNFQSEEINWNEEHLKIDFEIEEFDAFEDEMKKQFLTNSKEY